MTEDTQKSIKDSANNLIKKHRNMIAKYSSDYANLDKLSKKCAIVSVNQILSVISTDWGIMYGSAVRKVIKSKQRQEDVQGAM